MQTQILRIGDVICTYLSNICAYIGDTCGSCWLSSVLNVLRFDKDGLKRQATDAVVEAALTAQRPFAASSSEISEHI